MDSDRDIQAIIDDPATSYWLRDALKAALKRDPIDAAHAAEQLASIRALKFHGGVEVKALGQEDLVALERGRQHREACQ